MTCVSKQRLDMGVSHFDMHVIVAGCAPMSEKLTWDMGDENENVTWMPANVTSVSKLKAPG